MRSAIKKVKRIIRWLTGNELINGANIKVYNKRFGSSYGGWNICTEIISESSVVYTFGAGTDISFDLALIKHYDCAIYAFDPTPVSVKWIHNQQLPDKFKFTELGVADFDGEANFTPPADPKHASYSISAELSKPERSLQKRVERLGTIMTRLGHDHIDLLKMDIEGAEYDVIEDILNCKLSVRQILVEFHHRFDKKGVARTRYAIGRLTAAGYKTFWVSPSGEEFGFVKVLQTTPTISCIDAV